MRKVSIYKKEFLNYIKPFLKSAAFKKIETSLTHIELIDGKWLLKNEFEYSLGLPMKL